MLWLFILLRILANPFSNVFQKILGNRGAGPLAIIAIAHLLMAGACAPFLLLPRAHLPSSFWANILLSVVLAVSGNALIVAALKRCDLSVLGPINAYKAIVSLLPAILLLHEIPSPRALIGMALIIAGSYSLIDSKSGQRLWSLAGNPGIQLRLAGLVLSAIEAVFLKRAIQSAVPVQCFFWWAILGAGVSAIALLSTDIRPELALARQQWPAYLLLAITTALMQLSTLLTFQKLQVGSSLALFQLSTLLTVFLGWRIFREGHFLRRTIGAGVMVVGAVLIITGK